jgi:hypothetical protein
VSDTPQKPNPIQLWRADQSKCKAALVDCPDGSLDPTEHIMRDADGFEVFSNSHFKTEAEAWECLEADARARLHINAKDVKRAEEILLEAQKESAESVKYFHDIDSNKRRRDAENQ